MPGLDSRLRSVGGDRAGDEEEKEESEEEERNKSKRQIERRHWKNKENTRH